MVFERIGDIQAFLTPYLEDDKKIGFVPTMGFLHEGHLRLVKRSMAENDLTVLSIFVNPIQFNNPEDLKKYPRDVSRDLEMLQQLGCDVVFVPSTEEMYPENIVKTYDLGRLEEVMEGVFRPGHFQGVAVVVHKLFEIVAPHQAYFGQKDYQQLQVIRRLVEIESIPVRIVACETVREADGLAMSSRNVRLGEEERQIAPDIYLALKYAKDLVPTTNPQEVRFRVRDRLNAIQGFQLEYFEIADARTLAPILSWSDCKEGAVACVAGYLGGVRLIDNMLL